MKPFKESPSNPEEGKKEWSEEYAPKEYIQQDWYDSIFNEIEEKEWKEMLQKTSNSSAPGLSNIGCTIIKKLGKKATKLLFDLLNTILMEGEMPKKWKVGMIFLIPKMAEWDLQLENSRLIMLLEAT